MLLTSLILTVSPIWLRISRAQAAHDNSDQVALPYGQFQGYTNQTSALTYFLGMPYAAAPVGPLRFNVPHPPPSVSGMQDATKYGAACIQQPLPSAASSLTLAGFGKPIPEADQSEDCLFINVIKPRNIAPGSQLPVLFWIFGGAWELGDTASSDGSPIVERSIALEEPVIYVSANYRVNAYGFLRSKEIKAAGVGNLGLRDQRYAMEWINKNIHLFGGDKDKVTIWGESAGAISVGCHLVANGGNPGGLFRGGFMNSGSPPPLSDITDGQIFYDTIVNDTGCAEASDTLDCLRGVPQENITSAMLTTPSFFSNQSLRLAYTPSVDGDFFKENPQESIAKGAYAKVPFVTGDCLDEGTLFSTTQTNLSTSAALLDYIHSNYFPKACEADIEEIGRLYPDDPAQGSPFGSGNETFIYPQYKRLAAFSGDFFFQSHRRFFLEAASKTQNTWSFDYRRKDSGAGPTGVALGVHHGADALSFGFLGPFLDFDGMDAVINFVNHLTPTRQHPNSTMSISWPTWGESRSSLTFWDSLVLNMTSDTEREEAIAGLTALLKKFPI